MTYDSNTTNTDEAFGLDARKLKPSDSFNDEQSNTTRNANLICDAQFEPHLTDQLNSTVTDTSTAQSKPSVSSLSSSLSTFSLSDPPASSRSFEGERSEVESPLVINEEAEKTVVPVEVESESFDVKQSDGCLDKKSQETSAGDYGESLVCYDPILDGEIRNRLDKLNALSDLINSLELQFDEANLLFRETLKCSTERLSAIVKAIGSKSIRIGRSYNETKSTVEKQQFDCQRACVQFEKANHDHQFAKQAIKEAELKLRNLNSEMRVGLVRPSTSLESIGLSKFQRSSAAGSKEQSEYSKETRTECDNGEKNSVTVKCSSLPPIMDPDIVNLSECKQTKALKESCRSSTGNLDDILQTDEAAIMIQSSTKLSEDLNQALVRLVDAEEKRRQSERMHLDKANKLMIAQENLKKLEREHGASIRRAQMYFDEARHFNAKLDFVKTDIVRLSKEIVEAKKAYARTLNELEQFSEDLHINSKSLLNKPAEASN